MLNIDMADNNIRQMLYVFRYFYSNAFKFNIMMHSEDWNLPNNVINSDIIGLLKKDIRNLKYTYIPTVGQEDTGKLDYVEGRLDDLYKLKFDDNNSLSECFYIAYKTIKTLMESKKYLLVKWFVVSFFEKYLPVVLKAYDIYVKANNIIVLGIKDDFEGIGDLAKEIIRKDVSSMQLASSYHLLCKYILELNRDNKYVDIRVLKYCYTSYLRYQNTPNSEAAEDVENDNNDYLDKLAGDIVKVQSDDTIDDVVILDVNGSLKNITDKNKLINIIRQTIKVIKENEGEDINFNINEDFTMYFVTSKEDFSPVFIKTKESIYTLINYNGNIYLLYMNGTGNVYGSALVSWFNDPNSIIKISPDNNGEFKFIINDINLNNDAI